MTKVLLAVIFQINNEPTFIEGYHPAVQPSMRICEDRAQFMRNYLATIPSLPKHTVLCGNENEIQRRIMVSLDTIL